MGTLFVDKLDPQSGTALEIGSSGDTMTVPSGATFNVAGTLQNGGVAVNNTPAFHAYISSNQAVSNATVTKAQFNTESFDTNNAYDNSTNYRFTPQTSGKYFIYAQIRLDSGSNNDNIDYCYIEILKNGSNATSSILDFRTDRDGRKFSVASSIILDMNGSSDYVETVGAISASYTADLKFTGNSDGSLSYFGGFKLI